MNDAQPPVAMSGAQLQFIDNVYNLFANQPSVSLADTLEYLLSDENYSSEPLVEDLADRIPKLGDLAMHQSKKILPWAVDVTERTLKKPEDVLRCDRLREFLKTLPPILDRYMTYNFSGIPLAAWAREQFSEVLRKEVEDLSDRGGGLHFLSAKATQKDLRDFAIQNIARNIHMSAPALWSLLDVLVEADAGLAKRREEYAEQRTQGAAHAGARGRQGADPSERDAEDDEDADGWREIDVDEELEASQAQPPSDVGSSEPRVRVKITRRQLKMIVSKVAVVSIILKCSNQRCNALASYIGTFLHTCNAPERVVEMLSCIGLSLSPTAINKLINTLAEEARLAREKLGETLTTTFTFDNYDVQLNSSEPTVENAGGRTLVHLTSATMMPLKHDVTADDLKVSKDMWPMSAHNPTNKRTAEFLRRSVLDLHSLHPEPRTTPSVSAPPPPSAPQTAPSVSALPPAPAQGAAPSENVLLPPPASETAPVEHASPRPPSAPEPSASSSTSPPRPSLDRRQRYSKWQFLRDLVEHGPSRFKVFAGRLKEDGVRPEDVGLIPLVKTEQTPAQAMDIDESTPQGCGDVIERILHDAGMGDLTEKGEDGEPRFKGKVDVSEHVVIVHCDLASVAHLQSFMDSRAVETTPWRRYQFVVIVPGLFHTLMACADAFWRLYIKDSQSQFDACSTFKHAKLLYMDKSTGKIATNPSFKMIHNIILHDGVCRRLACWAPAVELWDREKPGEDLKWEDVDRMAEELVWKHVAHGSLAHDSDPSKRDLSFENNQIRMRDESAYDELHYAMNRGDIDRVEDVLVPWIYIWRTAGKHQYANQITKFLLELHFLWPERLRRAIRLNWLVNPRGKRDTFRACDWIIELNNLYTKSIHGGAYSNRTVQYMIKESGLIDFYRWMQVNVEDNFCIPNRTIKHAPPNMAATYKTVLSYMKKNEETVFKEGRTVRYRVKDGIREGMHLAQRASVLGKRKIVGGESAHAEAGGEGGAGAEAEIVEPELTAEDFAI